MTKYFEFPSGRCLGPGKTAALCFAACIFFAAFSIGAEHPLRTWTNAEGRKIQARLVSLEGESVKLDMAGRVYTVPIGSLSQADQDHLKEIVRKIEAPHQDARKGSFSMALTHRMFSDPDDFYDTDIGKPTRKAIKQRDEDPIAPIRYDSAKESARVYVPAHYDGSPAFGVYIHISPGDEPNMPQGYTQVMDRHDLIMASPAKGGNKQLVIRRISLALDTLATLKADYAIDLDRVYIGGLSGGGITAMQAQLLHPEIWCGALSHARGMVMGKFDEEYYSETKTFDKNDFRKASRVDVRYAVLSGPDDWNYDHCVSSSKAWEDDGFDIRFFDIASMGHENAPPGAFEEALVWVAESKRKR